MLKNFTPILLALILFVMLVNLWFIFPDYINEKRYLLENPNASNVGVPQVDLAKNGQFGDSYGSFNALLSVITVVGLCLTIYFQITQLNIQRNEIRDTRAEFHNSRLTDIIYKQLDRIDNEISQFEIKYQDQQHKGLAGFTFLYYSLNALYRECKNLDDIKAVKENKKALGIILSNEESILKMLIIINNSVAVLKEVIVYGKFSVKEINELKNIFFLNIGQMQLAAMLEISKSVEVSSNISTKLPELYDDFESIGSIYIFRDIIFSILHFYSAYITEENIIELKKQWIDEYISKRI